MSSKAAKKTVRTNTNKGKNVKEPLQGTRLINLILGFVILGLVLIVVTKDGGTEIYETLIFALASVENFIAALVSFSEQRKVRGNVYAVVCTLCLIISLVLAVRYFVL